MRPLSLSVCLSVYLFSRVNHAPDAARGLTFVTLVVGLISVILVNRSWSRSAWAMLRVPNRAVVWVLLGTFVFLAVAQTASSICDIVMPGR